MDTLSNPNLIDVTAAILTRNGQVLIAKRKPSSSLPNKWEFPGGKVENGETPEECLKRELEEEFGIEVSIGESLVEAVNKELLRALRKCLVLLAEIEADVPHKKGWQEMLDDGDNIICNGEALHDRKVIH